jgi:hypothetical protein
MGTVRRAHRASIAPRSQKSVLRSSFMTPPLDKQTAEAPDWLEAELAALTPADRAAMQRVEEARALYGEDFERELRDLDHGRHPLQRSPA